MVGAALSLMLALLGAAPRPSMPEEVTLYVGEERVIRVTCNLARIAVDAALQRIAVGDASIADVKTIGNNQVLLIGATPGKTTLLFWCDKGQRQSMRVTVLPGSPPPKPGPPVPVKHSERPAVVMDERGARATSVTVVEFPGELRDVTEVVGADGGLSFVGVDGEGRRVTITATPYVPRKRSKPDAGVAPGPGP